MPGNAVYVGRPSFFGNPFAIGRPAPTHSYPLSRGEAADLFRRLMDPDPGNIPWWVEKHPELLEYRRTRLARLDELRGRDLACWCDRLSACHADTWLWLASLPADAITTELP
jgi:hypothetical protein